MVLEEEVGLEEAEDEMHGGHDQVEQSVAWPVILGIDFKHLCDPESIMHHTSSSESYRTHQIINT